MCIWVTWVGRGIRNLENWMEWCQLRIDDLDRVYFNATRHKALTCHRSSMPPVHEKIPSSSQHGNVHKHTLDTDDLEFASYIATVLILGDSRNSIQIKIRFCPTFEEQKATRRRQFVTKRMTPIHHVAEYGQVGSRWG